MSAPASSESATLRPGSGERFAVAEQTDDGAVLLDQEGVGTRRIQPAQRVVGAEFSRTGFRDRLENFRQGRHQAAGAITRVTSRTVSAPSGIPAGVVTRTS